MKQRKTNIIVIIILIAIIIGLGCILAKRYNKDSTVVEEVNNMISQTDFLT